MYENICIKFISLYESGKSSQSVVTLKLILRRFNTIQKNND